MFSVLVGCSQKQKINNLSILFIGNSFTFFNEMPNSLKAMAESKGKELDVDYSLTRDGANLKEFWEKGKALEAIKSRDWDYVVLQGHSQAALSNKEEFRKYVKIFNEEIKANNAKTLLYMTHTRSEDGRVVPEKQSIHNQVYLDIAQEIDAVIAPVGHAWLEVSVNHPNITLYDADNLHPSNLGSYLIASVFYGVLFEESAENATDKMITSKEKEASSILQKIAWKVVNELK